MLIAGAISGIQEYIFDVAHEGGAQARRLRARSFSIQLLAECAALRIRRAAGWDDDSVVFRSAGKFLLDGPDISGQEAVRVRAVHADIARWLLDRLTARLSFSMCIVPRTADPEADYAFAMRKLHGEKLRSWAAVATADGAWKPQELMLSPLDTPCAICRRAPATVDEGDRYSGSSRRVCWACNQDRQLGATLPGARWLRISEQPSSSACEVARCWVEVSTERPPLDSGELLLIEDPQAAAPRGLPATAVRRLARRIPLDGRGSPVEFTELARRSSGDKLLGVLKADVDSLGAALGATLKGGGDLGPLAAFTAELDGFFSSTLELELRRRPWDDIYTVFSGGDDLLVIGPWNVVVDFARQVNRRFTEQFAKRGLTMSAAVVLMKPKRPVRAAVEQAEHLLEAAKSEVLVGETEPKNQVAALGQIWKWQHHDMIVDAGKRLAGWVTEHSAQRSWLHTLLELALCRQAGDRGATARLAYHVGRNYPDHCTADANKKALRRWVDGVVAAFDELEAPEARYLPAITRYALAASREAQEE